MGSRQEPLKLEPLEQAMLNEAQLRFDYGVLYREFIFNQILLKYKDRDVKFDPDKKQFIETIHSQEAVQAIDTKADYR